MEEGIFEFYVEDVSSSDDAPEEDQVNLSDEACGGRELSFLAYERGFEDKSRQIAILSFVVDNAKILFDSRNVRSITSKDVFKMNFLLDDDEHNARNFLHQLCLQFIKIFDTRTSLDATSSQSNKLDYAKAELKEALRILHQDDMVTLEPLLFVLIRCRDVLENYVKVTCGRGKIESWKNVLNNCVYETLTITASGNNMKELSTKLSGMISELDEEQIFRLLETHTAIRFELKRTEECNECLLTQMIGMRNTIKLKESVITNLNGMMAGLNITLDEVMHKECVKCEKLEEEIKNIVREFEQKKQAQHTYAKNRMSELERYKSTIKHLKDDLYKERTRKCEDCFDLRKQLKDVLERKDEEKLALHASKESLTHEVQKCQLRIKELGQELEFEKKPKRCESCQKIDMQLMHTLHDLEQEKQAAHASNESLKLELQKVKCDFDRLNDELNLNAMFNCNMILEHNEVVNELTHQISACQAALCSNEELKNHMIIDHKNIVRTMEIKIKQLMRKLGEHNGDLELQGRVLNREHEKVVNDLKCQLATLQAELEKRVVDKEPAEE